MKVLTALKVYFLCDADEKIPLEDWAWMAFVGTTLLGVVLLGIFL